MEGRPSPLDFFIADGGASELEGMALPNGPSATSGPCRCILTVQVSCDSLVERGMSHCGAVGIQGC